MDNNYKQALINTFISSSFRDNADQDYIASRIMIKNNLFNQFYWSAQQSIEKYLKSILLYNYQSAKYGHDLLIILDSIKRNIPDLKFNLPNDVLEFIKTVSSFGNNRYIESSYGYSSHYIVTLDKTIWYLRKYCRYLRENTVFDSVNQIDSMFNELLNAEYNSKPPYNLEITDGFIEKVLKSNYKNLRKALSWNNYFYYNKKRNKVNFPIISGSQNSILIMYKEIYTLLKDKVYFSKNVRDYLDKGFPIIRKT